MYMKTRVKRVYDAPAKSDGSRVLIDRLWPRGVSKRDARIDLWAKDLAPSNALRTWFHRDPDERFAEFQKRYRAELTGKHTQADELLALKKPVTLVTAVKDVKRSHVPALVRFLSRLK